MRGTRKLVLALASLGAIAASAQAADIEVMTQNQYVGTELIGLVFEPDFNAAVVDALKTRAATHPAERIRALARLIELRNPALVGLVEIYEFKCVDDDAGDTRGCQNPEISGAFIDHLQTTTDALHGRYDDVGSVVNVDLPARLPAPLNALPGIPIAYDQRVIYVSMTDRDVILARSDVEATPVQFAALGLCTPSGDGCNYQEAASADIMIPPYPVPIEVRFERGFVGVDAVVGGQSYRFVVTHLETRLEGLGPQARGYQSAQAYQLTQVLAAAAAYLPADKQLVVGDFNSDPRDPVYPVPPGYPEFLGLPPYLQLQQAGFFDVWTLQPGAATAQSKTLLGLTCCQWEDLTNRRSDLYERVDLIWSSVKPRVRDARVLGESMGDKTLPKGKGLWPSDHASVAARLSIGR
ncbi:MAG TPA: endonuclease/exonuclease/phosphatase family protein [Steroidobacteraceae bacterium]|nr:endonuclease/exonuclease/phosphatase family protein [Steroidobacteraceae bacterium]